MIANLVSILSYFLYILSFNMSFYSLCAYLVPFPKLNDGQIIFSEAQSLAGHRQDHKTRLMDATGRGEHCSDFVVRSFRVS